MMSDVSPVLGLPYILPSQAQKHVTYNEALARLDAAVQLAVLSRGEVTPPPGAETGDRYLVPAGAQNEWAGEEGDIATWNGSAWTFQAPVAGWQAHVLDENATLRFDGTDWQESSGALSADTLGVNTSADTTNRLAVASPATLLTHEGAGHQLKINKAAAGDTNSLLFQTGWSGRAEMGCAGSDDFAIKVSLDGAAWTTALSFDGATGIAGGAAVQSVPTDTAAGKLARADYAYGPGNVLGPVSEAGGVPTGAVIESGSNANGDYVRFADGTQICRSRQELFYYNGALLLKRWYYPAVFEATSEPVVGGILKRNDLAANVTPSPGSILGIRTGQISYNLTDLFVERIDGATDFAASDSCYAWVTATGRWF